MTSNNLTWHISKYYYFLFENIKFSSSARSAMATVINRIAYGICCELYYLLIG